MMGGLLVLLCGFVQWNGLPMNARAISIELPTHGRGRSTFMQEEADRAAASSSVDVPVVHLKTGKEVYDLFIIQRQTAPNPFFPVPRNHHCGRVLSRRCGARRRYALDGWPFSHGQEQA
jgi:hypothetical protein